MNRRKLIIRTVVLTAAAVTGGLLGWRNLEAGRALEESRKPSELPPHVTLDVVSEGPSDDHERHEARLLLSNPTNGPIYYYGPYGRPDYTLERWDDEVESDHGLWLKQGLQTIRCGPGIGEQTLPAGGSLNLTISVRPESLPFRVAVAFSLQPSPRRYEMRHVWTKRIGADVLRSASREAARK